MGSLARPSPAESKLFKPVKVGNNTLDHRVVFAPLTRYRNNADHVPTPFMSRYYGERASTPGTLIISEASSISHDEEGQPHTASVGSDEQVSKWKDVIDEVHKQGSVYFQQLMAMGRASIPSFVGPKGKPYRTSSAVKMEGVDQTPAAMTEEEIQQTIRDFVSAGKRIVNAGADGVEIHSAHGYMLDQFISDAINQRTDKWGGSIENRARLTLEVVKAMVEAIGAERVAIRFSPFAIFQGAGSSDIHAQYTYIFQELKKMNVNFAYISLVEARGDPGAMLFGGKKVNQDKTLDFILELWDNASPVVVAGGYQPETAVRAVEEHYTKWDVLVAFGRHFLSNPDLVYKIKHNLPLTPYVRDTFYLLETEEGYNDYAFGAEWMEAKAKAQSVTA
jgi:NADPH2 dehydrogenase